MTTPPSYDTTRAPETIGQQVAREAQPRALAAMQAALGDLGDGQVRLAPLSALDVERDGTVLPVDIAGERYDLVISATLTRHRPPGWSEHPRWAVGDIIDLPDEREPEGTRLRRSWEVLDVLGERDDPRPGYRLRHMGRGPTGAVDRMQSDGTERVLPPGKVDPVATRIGRA